MNWDWVESKVNITSGMGSGYYRLMVRSKGNYFGEKREGKYSGNINNLQERHLPPPRPCNMKAVGGKTPIT
jgi:hypothetical protein